MKVLVTRPAAQAKPLSDALRAQGFDVVEQPLISIEPLSDEPIDVDNAVRRQGESRPAGGDDEEQRKDVSHANPFREQTYFGGVTRTGGPSVAFSPARRRGRFS